jgi:GTPase SAR1 family protein
MSQNRCRQLKHTHAIWQCKQGSRIRKAEPSLIVLTLVFSGAAAAVLAFSTTDRESFEAIGQWKRKVEAECGNIPMALVQNKVDLLDQAVVTK